MIIKYKQTTQKDRHKNGTEIFPSFSYSHKIMNHNFIEYSRQKELRSYRENALNFL